tara:strand:+ start:1343 stop:1639 length:297 start_codon:yes stop_codon:yes gene_type:complete
MTPEAKVKKKAAKVLKEFGVYYFYPATGGYGKSGVPDIVCCYKGLFLGLECKAGKNKATELQKMNLEQIKEAGGIALIVNEDNVMQLHALLTKLGDKR